MEYGKKERLGGFNLLKFKKDEQTFIKVSTIMGHWVMMYREDCTMFQWLDMERTKEQDEAIRVILVNAYMSATLVEAAFQHDILVAAEALQGRINKDAEVVSDKEDAEILKDLQTEHEIMEEMANQFDGEEGKTEESV